MPAQLPRPRLALALAAVSAWGCSESTGPTPVQAEFYALRVNESGIEIWQHRNGTASEVIPDSLPLVTNFAVAPDGRMAFVVYRATPGRVDVVEYSADGRPLRTAVAGPNLTGYGPLPRRLAYSPDGTRLAWTWSRADRLDSLYVLDAGATTPRGIASRALPDQFEVPGADGIAPMRWTPQGELVFGPALTLVGVHPATGATRPIISGPIDVIDFDFAADGRLAAAVRVSSASGYRSVISVQRTPEGALTQLPTSENVFAQRVRWSPDGRHIATVGPDTSYDGTNGGTLPGSVFIDPVLMVLPLDGGAPIWQRELRVIDVHGWTRDGRVLLSGLPMSNNLTGADIYAVTPGGRFRNLTNTPTVEERAVFLRP